MERSPRLLDRGGTGRIPGGLVLLLHGGANRRGNPMVSPAQLSVLRMIPIAKRIARAGRGRLGCSGCSTPTAAGTARTRRSTTSQWALGELEGRYGAGCRSAWSATRSAAARRCWPVLRRACVSVVALNPWVYPTDEADLTGRRVLVIHGTDDRVASIERRDGGPAAGEDRRRRLPDRRGRRHAMLRRGKEFERPAAEFAVHTLVR